MEMMMQAGDSAERISELSDSEHQVVPSITRGNMRSWGGMRIAWICVGVDDYRYIDKLKHAVRDATAVHRKIKSIPNCQSMLIQSHKC